MSDINSYALSIELTLQSNAQEVLKGVTDEISGIETKVKNLIDNMSRSMDTISSGVRLASKDMSASVRSIDNAIKSTDMGSPAAELADSVERVAESAGSLTNRSKELDDAISEISRTAATAGGDLSGAAEKFALPVEELVKIRKAMILASDVDFMQDEQEYVDEATKQYKYLADDIFPKLLDQRSEMLMQGKDLGQVEMKVLLGIEEVEKRMVRQRGNASRLVNRLKKKGSDDSKKDAKIEGKSLIKLLWMNKEKRDEYEQLTEAMKARSRISGALGTADEKPVYKKQEQQLQGMQDRSKAVGKLKEVFGNLSSAVKKVTAGFSSMMKTMGYGQLAEAASVTGLYGAAVGKAAEEEEKFHTINFRAIGSMRSMQATVRDLSIKFPALRSEFIDATIALREVGGTKKDINDLVPVVAFLGRTTGASAEALSKFAKSQKVVYGTTQKARKEMLMMQRGAKELGLTGKDLDQILGSAADAAFLMGSKGEVYAGKYSVMLLKAAGAAKKLGLSTEDAMSYVDRMKDPLEVIKVLGREAFSMDPAQRMEAMGKAAGNTLEQLNKMAESEEKYGKRREIMALFNIKSIGNVEKELKMMHTTAEQGEDAFKKGMQKPQEEINDAMKNAAGLQRDTAVVMEKTMSKLQKTMEPVLKFMESINEYLAKSPMATTMMSWATMAGAVGSVFSSVFGILVDVGLAVLALPGLKALAPLTKGANLLKTAFNAVKATRMVTFFGRMIKPVTSLTRLLPIARLGMAGMGKALLSFALNPLTLAVAAIAGVSYWAWKIASDTIKAEKSVYKTNIARLDATRNLENQGLLLHDQLEIEIHLLKVKKAKLIADNKGKPATKTIRDMEKEIHSIQLKQGTRLNKNWGIMKQREAALKRAMKTGTKEKAIQAALSLEAIKQDKTIKDLAKDKELTKKITQDTAKAYKDQQFWIKSARDELEKGNKAEASKEKMAVKTANAFRLSKDQAKSYLDMIKKHKSGTEEHGKAVADIAELFGTKAEGLEQKLGNIVKGVEQKPMEEAEKKLQEAAQKAKDTISKADGPEAKYAAMREQATLFGVPTAQVEEKLDQLTKATETKGKVTPETLTTSKITDETARPTTEEDRKLVAATKNNVLLEDLARRVDKTGNLEDLMRLLKDYLPKIADKDTGLASTANQWV